ncbi:BatD family protein [Thermodesulfobacteriota bacterium]
MNSKFVTATAVIIWAFAAALPQALPAEDLSAVARVDATRITIDDQLNLTISLSGDRANKASDPDLSMIEGFQVAGSSQSSNISIVNGQMNVIKEFTYTLLPKKVGIHRIGPIAFTIRRERHETNAVVVEVLESSIPSAAALAPSSSGKGAESGQRGDSAAQTAQPRIFLRAEADRTSAFVGEQVTIDYILYTNRSDISNLNRSEMPSFDGFWAEEIYSAKRLQFTDRVIDGQPYRAALLQRIALFPILSGEAVVDSMVLTCQVPVRGRRSRRSLFGDMDSFFSRGKEIVLRSRPMIIRVDALPEAGRPEGFTGSVGEYTIDASIDADEMRVGDPLTLILRIAGTGNPETIREPEIRLPDAFEKYDPKVTESSNAVSGPVRGEKRFEYILIPREEGDKTIPAVELSYFNPATQAYASVSTKAFLVRVTPGRAGEGSPEPMITRENIHLIGKDIRYIKPDRQRLPAQGRPLYSWWPFWIIQALPIVLIVGAALHKRHRERLATDVGYARLRRAGKAAIRGLQAAGKAFQAGRTAKFHADVSKTLTGYLADRVNVSAAGMTREGINAAFEALGARDEDRSAFVEILRECDFARFAPSGTDADGMRDLLGRARNLIRSLERGR